MKTALITGINGQDGAFLSKLLIHNGYKVYGGTRDANREESFGLEKIGTKDEVEMVNFDLTNTEQIHAVLNTIRPDEIYNLAAMSVVNASFDIPVLTQKINFLGVLEILENIRKVNTQARFFQASSSEMFGNPSVSPQNENTKFNPRTPYGISKVAAHMTIQNYRDKYGIFAVSGILYNHESSLRGKEFVTLKICNYVSNYQPGMEALEIGNLDARRDWGYAGDYVKAMHAMLNHETPDDFIISTGITHSVRDFVTTAFKAREIELEWQKNDTDPMGEVAINKANKEVVVRINKEFYRAPEKVQLVGDPFKINSKIGWQAETKFEDFIRLMVNSEV